MATKNKPPLPPVDLEAIRDVSERVYRARLGERESKRMVEKDADGGRKLRNRAGSYDTLTRCYLQALGIEIPRLHISLFD